MKLFLAILAVVALTFPLHGCTGDEFSLNAYKALKTSYTLYDAGMQACSEAERQGIINAEQRSKINGLAGKYLDAYSLSVTALYGYTVTKDTAKESVSDAIGTATKALEAMLQQAYQMGIEVK